MGFKNLEQQASFADLILKDSMDKNRCLEQLMNIQDSIENSDPELESQINDRVSFKKFLGLSFSDPSPDHSTFSRFRKRLSKKAMDQINSEILRQFSGQGLTINEGIAIDARLVRSASRPKQQRNQGM